MLKPEIKTGSAGLRGVPAGVVLIVEG